LKILVTNDDGIQSKGILVLAKTLQRLGEVFVVAPDREQSAIAHSLTLHRPLRVEKIKKNFYSVDGTPADCIHLGVNVLSPERPCLIVSGINKGENLGNDINYSGTVSAAFEGTLFGIPSFAISLAIGRRFRFDSAAQFAVRMAKYILKRGLPKNTFLNINVPNLDGKEIRSYQITKQARWIRNGSAVIEKTDPRGKKYYWIASGELILGKRGDTDFEALSQASISITPLHVDLTDYASLKGLKKWKL
jgi:5'-nucleotidase